MTTVECLRGEAETQVGGFTYVFQRRADGLFVAEVADYNHVMLLTSVRHYRVAPPLEVTPPEPLAEPVPPVQNPPATDQTQQEPLQQVQEPAQDTGQQNDGPDDLTLIVGVGKGLAEKLGALGVTSFEQVAAWSPEDVASFTAALGPLAGIESKDWVGQAKALIAARSTQATDQTQQEG